MAAPQTEIPVARTAGFHPLRVADVERLCDDAVAVTFDVPADLRGDFDFAAGQSLSNEAGWSAFVRRASGQCRAEETEVTSWPASLIVAMEGGGSVTFENGRWSCGA